MQNASHRATHTAKQGVRPGKQTVVCLIMAAVGAFGMAVLGYFMQTALAPFRVTSEAGAKHGFDSFGDMLIIPGFLLSVYLFAFAVYGLYKAYRRLNDPKNYGAKSRRS